MEKIDIRDNTTGAMYRKGKLLGKGGFAKCYEFRDSAAKLIAGKVVPKTGINSKSNNNREKLYQEIRIHRNLDHPNIVSFITCFEDECNVYIMLELCCNKTLLELHKRRTTITEPETRYYSTQIAQACTYLHENRIIHRDLKLANIFLNTNMNIKIGDFGLASKLDSDNERRKTMCGTPNYIAPEILRKDGHSYAVDMWSLGCIIYTMLVGKPPFETDTLRETYSRIKRNEYHIPQKISLHAREIITSLLDSNPERRPTMKNLIKMQFYRLFTPTSLPVSALSTTPRFDTVTTVNPTSGILRSVENTLYMPSDHAVITGQAVVGENNDTNYLNTIRALIQDLYQYGKIVKSNFASSTKQFYLMDDSEDPTLGPVYWVSKWVDYSDRYGLGYQLSDGSNGVIFNDCTRIIMSGDGINLQYIEKDSTEKLYTINSRLSSPLQKKSTLLNYFRQYMNENLMTAGENMVTNGQSMVRLPYVKAWFRTKTAIVLYLSNGTMQVNMFTDHIKLIVCPLMSALTVLDGTSDFKTFKIKSLRENGITSDLQIRLEYCLKMVTKVEQSISPP